MSSVPTWLAIRRRTGAHTQWDRTIAGPTRRWTRGLLVAQVALSMVLLVGAMLLTRPLYLLQRQDPGVRTATMLDIKLWPLPNAGAAAARRAAGTTPLHALRSE